MLGGFPGVGIMFRAGGHVDDRVCGGLGVFHRGHRIGFGVDSWDHAVPLFSSLAP